MKFDETVLKIKFQEIIQDIKERKIRSSAWIWLCVGALSGILLSSLRTERGRGIWLR